MDPAGAELHAEPFREEGPPVVNTANAWPNYYAGFLWLAVFIAFVAIKYPHGKRGGQE